MWEEDGRRGRRNLEFNKTRRKAVTIFVQTSGDNWVSFALVEGAKGNRAADPRHCQRENKILHGVEGWGLK